jgi:hypothetical protein
MNRACLVLLVGALLLLRGGAVAQQANAPAQQAPAEEVGPPTQEVVSAGTLPDELEGRWLLVGWIGIGDGDRAKTTTALWEVTREDAQLVFREYYRELPAGVAQKVVEANAGDTRWRPTPEDLAEIGAAWDTLAERDPRLSTVRNELYGADGFDRDFKHETSTKDAIWAARQTGNFRKSAAPSVRSINVVGAIERRDGGWAGNYTAANIAAAPFPIPIKLEGKFQMYRLAPGAPPAKRGFLESLFSGCGR